MSNVFIFKYNPQIINHYIDKNIYILKNKIYIKFFSFPLQKLVMLDLLSQLPVVLHH